MPNTYYKKEVLLLHGQLLEHLGRLLQSFWSLISAKRQLCNTACWYSFNHSHNINQYCSSWVLNSPNNSASDFQPVNTIIQFLIHQANDHHVVPSDQIQSMRNLARRLGIIWRSYNTLCSLWQNLTIFSILVVRIQGRTAYQVCHLVAREQHSHKCPRIASQYQDLLYPAVRMGCKLCNTPLSSGATGRGRRKGGLLLT